ncbi:unnamed protein product [Symbiodinium sp. CCMP2592]|nr:unnamed protein product [Symbiodinium sp. CCMP2592]
MRSRLIRPGEQSACGGRAALEEAGERRGRSPRQAAARATAQAGRWCPDEIDDLVREVTLFLQHRASVLLVSQEQPPWDLTSAHPTTIASAAYSVCGLYVKQLISPETKGQPEAGKGKGQGPGPGKEAANPNCSRAEPEEGDTKTKEEEEEDETLSSKSSEGTEPEEEVPAAAVTPWERRAATGDETSPAEPPQPEPSDCTAEGEPPEGTPPQEPPAERPSEGCARTAAEPSAPAADTPPRREAASPAGGVDPPPNPFPPAEWIYRIDTECRSGSHLQVIRLPVPGHSTAADVLERLHMRTGFSLGALRLTRESEPLPLHELLCVRVPAGTAKLYASTAEGVTLRQDSEPPVVTTDMLWCIACRVRVPTPEHMQGTS